MIGCNILRTTLLSKHAGIVAKKLWQYTEHLFLQM